MTVRIESGRSRLVIDRHANGETFIAFFLDGSCLAGMMLNDEQRTETLKALCVCSNAAKPSPD